VRKKYRISRRTIFYLKEYGPKSHVARVILKESILILIFASILSSVGGIGLQNIQERMIAILPLLVILPALNDMIGDFGTIVSSRFAAMLYLGQVHRKNWWSSHLVHGMLRTVFSVALISAIYMSTVAMLISLARGFPIDFMMFAKVAGISLVSTLSLVGLIVFISIIGGFYIFSKREDPNNFLIPITTGIADLGSMIIFSVIIAAVF
jgi:cation transporter-like permease